MSYHTIDPETWPRRSHFELFEAMDHPWFDMCCTINATKPWQISSTAGGPSFFAATLFLAIGAANQVEEMRTRIRGNEVIVHDHLDVGSTILRDNGTFGFGFISASDDFSTFAAATAAESARVSAQTGPLIDRDVDDLIHFSVVPWSNFTSIGHPRQRGMHDSIPKIVIGRCTETVGQWRLPVAVSVHHGLADGLHVARFLDEFESRCARADTLLSANPPTDMS